MGVRREGRRRRERRRREGGRRVREKRGCNYYTLSVQQVNTVQPW